jgi:hypothetical protein
MGLKARPVRMPDLMDQASMTRWPVCYQPEVPMLVLKGVRGVASQAAEGHTIAGEWDGIFLLS